MNAPTNNGPDESQGGSPPPKAPPVSNQRRNNNGKANNNNKFVGDTPDLEEVTFTLPSEPSKGQMSQKRKIGKQLLCCQPKVSRPRQEDFQV